MNAICPCVAEIVMKPFSELSHCIGPNWANGSHSSGGPSCMRSAADDSPHISAICYCFRFFIFFAPFLNQITQNASGIQQVAKFSIRATRRF